MVRARRMLVPLVAFVAACNVITGASDLRTGEEPLVDGGAHADAVESGAVDPGTPGDDDDDVVVDAGHTDDATTALDAADAADVPTTPSSKRVFVTSTAFTGDLGGLAGADAKCAELAKAAGLAGTFVAWLSAAGSHAKDRVTGDGPWLLVGQSDVAVTKAQLTSAPISRALRRNESGAVVMGLVWTGTFPTGNSAGEDCDGWTGVGGIGGGGRVGDTMTSGPAWTSATTSMCGSTRRLYCFQL
ncbi:MAG: hypothetical protein KF764_28935 [Labilithrix sp.]|nr:hypothetical protein [Labilithrix sp.]